MKIGYDAKRAFNNSSGLGNYSRDVIQAVRNFYNDELFLFTPKVNNQLFSIDNVNIIKPENKRLASLWRTFGISKKVKKLNIDIYHGLSNEIPFGINKNTKTVITVHDLIFKRYPKWYNTFDRMIYDKKVGYGLKNADKVIAISKQTKNDIIEFYGTDERKIEVVYQTCNEIFKHKADSVTTQKVKAKYNLPEKYLLYVGTIEPRKNALNIVKAIDKLKIDIPLIIIGRETPYADKIRNFISKNKLDKQVKMLNNVLTHELPVFYQDAEIFIYPSTFEGFGIPIIEALYSGTPVITTKGGVFPEAGGEHSVYINPENIEELGNAIKELLDDENKREKMIKSGLEYVKNFDTEKVTKELYNIYLSLL